MGYSPLSHAQIQNFYIGIGASVTYAPLEAYNKVLDFYQNQRVNLDPNLNPEGESYDNEISNVNMLIGPSFSFGYMFNPNFNLELRYARRNSSERESLVRDINNNAISRTFDVNSNTFGMGLSRLFAGGRSDYIIGSTFNVTRLRSTVANSRKPNIIDQHNYGLTLFAKYIFHFGNASPMAIVINPYFQYHLTPIDFNDLNRLVNPQTFISLSGSDNLQGARTYFGMEIQLAFFVFTRFNKEPIDE